MRPLRADETVGSGLIHSDMFKDLRDRPVVLADLSLENPNVFYELGIRHVMSPSGTVLMCRKGTTLPFDVGHQRVIFYNFDGAALDWEEVENTVKALKLALQEAARKELDSPVHALLTHVLRFNGSECLKETATHALKGSLIKYQQALARTWLDCHVEIKTLINQHIGDDFVHAVISELGAPGRHYLSTTVEDARQDRIAVAAELPDGIGEIGRASCRERV